MTYTLDGMMMKNLKMLGILIFISYTAGCGASPPLSWWQPKSADQQGAALAGNACAAVSDTPSLIDLVMSLKPPIMSASDFYSRIRQVGCKLGEPIGTMSTLSVQPADPITNSPRCLVTINKKIIATTGPEGNVELATFPIDSQTGELKPSFDEQFADIKFEGSSMHILRGAESAGCDSCHFGYVPIAFGKDAEGDSTNDRPFQLHIWHQVNCGARSPHNMCPTIHAMLGLETGN